MNTRLQRGQLDLALLVEPVEVTAPDARCIKTLGITQPVWVAAHDYRLDLARPVPLTLHGKGCPYRTVAVDALTRLGRSWRVVIMSAMSLWRLSATTSHPCRSWLASESGLTSGIDVG